MSKKGASPLLGQLLKTVDRSVSECVLADFTGFPEHLVYFFYSPGCLSMGYTFYSNLFS